MRKYHAKLCTIGHINWVSDLISCIFTLRSFNDRADMLDDFWDDCSFVGDQNIQYFRRVKIQHIIKWRLISWKRNVGVVSPSYVLGWTGYFISIIKQCLINIGNYFFPGFLKTGTCKLFTNRWHLSKIKRFFWFFVSSGC